MDKGYKIMRFIKSTFVVAGLSVCLMGLSGCEMTSESQLNVQGIEMRKEIVNQTIPAGQLDHVSIRAIAQSYARNGASPLEVTVTYPAGQEQAQIQAEEQARALRQAFSEYGVEQVSIYTLETDKAAGDVVVGYTAVSAHAPKDCLAHPMDDRTSIEADDDGIFENYRYGCGISAYTAAQVARPRDLMGRSPVGDNASGERFGNILKDYRAGEKFDPLDGSTASETKY
jgi:type IV pilus biogenesis protein CpaD/CtpE